MKKLHLTKKLALALCCTVCTTVILQLSSCSSSMKTTGQQDYKQAIAFSLKELTKKASSPDRTMDSLFGINMFLGYVVDLGTDDVIIIGAKTGTGAEILLDDFCAAIKNATSGIEPPCCSLDPRPQEIASIERLNMRLSKAFDDRDREEIVTEWRKTPGYQGIRVLGVDAKSHFAKTMIYADYLLKKIADGTYNPKIKGFKSFLSLALDAQVTRVEQNDEPVQDVLVSRFWFYPGKNRYVRDANTVYLKDTQIKLLTEEMYLSSLGTQISSQKKNPVAEEFANMVTEKYGALSKNEPLFAQLQALYQLETIQKMLVETGTLKQCGINLSFWQNEYKIKEVYVPDSLQSTYAFGKTEVAKGVRNIHIVIPISGGIIVNPKIETANYTEDASGMIKELEASVLKARPAVNSVSWKFKLPEGLKKL